MIINKDLLYSTGNSVQEHVQPKWGKNLKNSGDMYN